MVRNNQTSFALFFLSACTMFLASVASARAGNCGSGWSEWVVPDSIPLVNCQFASCCGDHDVCYGKCEGDTSAKCSYLRCKRGGDLYRSTQCQSDTGLLQSARDAKVRKNKCDNDFYSALRALNSGRYVCEALAIAYFKAVKDWGEPHFSGFDASNPVAAWRQPQDDYNQALKEFFRNGTDAQFKKLVEGFDGGRPSVDFRQPLRFDPTQGLVNLDLGQAR